ncbi:MAG: triose-phosphate isomerase [Candidatus Methanomethylicaceae archaeon]
MKLSYPLILINYKTYLESLGNRGLNLAKIAERVSSEYGVCTTVAPQFVDIFRISREVTIPVLAQHVDPEVPAAYTGHITPESIKEAGGCGTLLNHSERRLRIDVIEDSIIRCKSLGLVTCVCANNATIAKALSTLKPEMLAIEPPELIGSGISVSKARPEVITTSIEMIKSVNPNVHILCGAGITDGVDVSKAIELGTEGVLVASGVVKAKDPEKVLRDFAAAIHL